MLEAPSRNSTPGILAGVTSPVVLGSGSGPSVLTFLAMINSRSFVLLTSQAGYSPGQRATPALTSYRAAPGG